MAIIDDRTPLIPRDVPLKRKWSKAVLYNALFCGFIISLSFTVTQVPLVYVFRIMTCDAYYQTHPEPPTGGDRCAIHEIESSTAVAVSLLGTSTTFFGVVNLFITGWSIKKFGLKSALLIQVFWPAVRLCVQNIGVAVGGNLGITIIQSSQIITVIGGPAGYLLTLNSYIAEVSEHKERTGALGKLQGTAMFGNAIGFLAGGLISDAFGIAAPFEVTIALFLSSCVYVAIFLPWIPPSEAAATRAPTGISRLFGPLKMFAPQKWILRNGRTTTEYGVLLLGLGVFLGVLATGYIPVLLQMYSTDVLGFKTKENGFLISLNSLVRGLFLYWAFPHIISVGRNWVKRKEDSKKVSDLKSRAMMTAEEDQDPNTLAEVEALENSDGPAVQPQLDDEKETFEFDLMFTKYSLIVDGILTGAAFFVTKGWQIYLVAVLLPFASGTGASAKGTILQMCPASERTDALNAITLLEMVARLSTVSIFGMVYAAFADIGKPYLVFTCNAAVALLGFLVLQFSRFPAEGSRRLSEERVEERNTT